MNQAGQQEQEQEQDVCPICLYAHVNPLMLPCQHRICSKCYSRFLAHEAKEKTSTRRGTRISCPICRTQNILALASARTRAIRPKRAVLARLRRLIGARVSSYFRVKGSRGKKDLLFRGEVQAVENDGKIAVLYSDGEADNERKSYHPYSGAVSF